MAAELSIPEATLVDWLADRKFLKQQWRQKLQALQARAEEAAHSLPPALAGELEGGVSYRTASAVEARLRDAEQRAQLGCSKGDYTLWSKLVKAYEKENLHLGEAALALVRNGQFEIPFHRNRIAKQQQQLVDLEKREGEYKKSALDSQRAHLQECQAIGVAGDDVEKELRQLAAELPAAVQRAATHLQDPSLAQAVEYYKSFCAFTACSEGGAQDALPLVSELSPATLRLHVPEHAAQEGCRTGDEGHPSGASLTLEGGADIDWDFDGVAAAASNGVTAEEGGAEEGSFAEIEGARNAVVVELSELRAFYQLRRSEMASATYAAIVASAPERLQQTDGETVQRMAAAVAACLAAYTSVKLKRLIALGHSRRYFDRTVAALQRQASQQSKYYRLQKEVEAKRQELQSELVTEAATLSSLSSASAALRMLTERQLEALLKAVRVQLTGGTSSATA